MKPWCRDDRFADKQNLAPLEWDFFEESLALYHMVNMLKPWCRDDSFADKQNVAPEGWKVFVALKKKQIKRKTSVTFRECSEPYKKDSICKICKLR